MPKRSCWVDSKTVLFNGAMQHRIAHDELFLQPIDCDTGVKEITNQSSPPTPTRSSSRLSSPKRLGPNTLRHRIFCDLCYAQPMPDLPPRSTLLETLRLSRGLTQMELSHVTGIPQATLSKVESGSMELDLARWHSVASALGVPADAFLTVTTSVTPDRVFHRKRKSTPISAIRKIGADLALTRQRIDDLLGAPPTKLRRQDLDDGFVTPQEVARAVRDELDLGTDPIGDLTALVERAGVLILRWPLETLQVDAIAAWPEDSAPVILVGEHVAPERLRFTMAHELGHAVMHDGEPTEEREREADAFAAELLLPAERVRSEWPTHPTLESLIPLKRRWGISLSALIRRASDTGILDERSYREWNIRLSTSGMHRREPEPLEPERPRALTDAIQTALSSGFTVEELAAKAHMHPQEFSLTFLEEFE